MRILLAAVVACFVVAGCSPAVRPTTAPVPPADANSPASVTPTAPGSVPAAPATAGNPGENASSALPADRRITDEIRQKIHGVESMSANAHSVQIITAGGKVSLRGTVDSAEQKDTVEKLAAEVVGKDNVTSDVVWKDKE